MPKIAEGFDLNLLRLLVALHRTRSVSKAAENLNLSQPATSLALSRLRKAVGDELFVRTPTGMMPTSLGSELAAAAEPALLAIDTSIVRRSIFEPKAACREFVLTMADGGELHFMPRLMAFLSKEAPSCSLRCVQTVNEDMGPALESGDVDLVLGNFPSLRNGGLFKQQLFMHSLVCLVRADHPIVRANTMTLATFLELSHAVVHAVGRSNEIFETLLKKKGLRRRIQLQSAHFLTVPAAISQTDLIVTVPRAVADYYAHMENLRIVEPPINIGPYPIYQYWHSRFHTDPALVWLRKSIVALFAAPSKAQSRPVGGRKSTKLRG